MLLPTLGMRRRLRCLIVLIGSFVCSTSVMEAEQFSSESSSAQGVACEDTHEQDRNFASFPVLPLSVATEDRQLQSSRSWNSDTGIVDLYFLGRLGNNLFEYAAARTLADSLGWRLAIQPDHHNRKKFGILTRPEGMRCFPGIRPIGPPVDSDEAAGMEIVRFRNMKTELQDPSPRIIKMVNWYQDYSLFSANKERIRDIMAMNTACCGSESPGPDDLVIHHRNYRSELTPEQYENLHFKDIDFRFYEKILMDAGESDQGLPGTVWLVGEFDDDDPLVEQLRQIHDQVRKPVLDEGPFEAFCFLMRAPRFVMARSTFSWWAAFLGNATTVHYPLAKGGTGVTVQRVAVKNDPRYIYRDDQGDVVKLH